MKLKYYLKGIGVGIIFATLVLSISFAVHDKKMDEEDIINEALELGMVWPERTTEGASEDATPAETSSEVEESTMEVPTTTEAPTTAGASEDATTAETSSEVEESTTEEPTTTEAPTTTAGASEDATPAETSSEVEEITTTETPTTEPPTTTQKEAGSIVVKGDIATIKIVKGMASRSAAKLLQQAGLIEDYLDFDKYIINEGYASKIIVGTYEIKKGATYDEIIKIICRIK